MLLNILKAGFDNPNGNISPFNPQLAALYYQDTGDNRPIIQFWAWSIQTQAWLALQPLENILQGNGEPSAAPPNPYRPALYSDLGEDGILYTWKVSTQEWI